MALTRRVSPAKDLAILHQKPAALLQPVLHGGHGQVQVVEEEGRGLQPSGTAAADDPAVLKAQPGRVVGERRQGSRGATSPTSTPGMLR